MYYSLLNFYNSVNNSINLLIENGINNIFNLVTEMSFTKLIGLDSIIIAFDVGKKIISGEKMETVIERYNNIYKMNWIIRVIIYFLLSNLTIFFKNKEMVNVFLIFLTIPKIQNQIINYTIVKTMIEYVKREITKTSKYLTARLFVVYLRKELDIKISNYNIFILMNNLEWNMIKEFVNNFIFIWIMMILRNYELTYYYYKGIKLSYYYNKGYMINKMEREQSIEIFKKIIDKKEWNKISNIEYTTALYNIIFYKSYDLTTYFKIFQYEFIKFIILWSWVEWVIIKNIYNHINLFIILSLSNFKIIRNKLFYFCILLTLYDNSSIEYTITSFFISIGIMSKDNIYTFVKNILFYIRNYKSISKVIRYYHNEINSYNSDIDNSNNK